MHQYTGIIEYGHVSFSSSSEELYPVELSGECLIWDGLWKASFTAIPTPSTPSIAATATPRLQANPAGQPVDWSWIRLVFSSGGLLGLLACSVDDDSGNEKNGVVETEFSRILESSFFFTQVQFLTSHIRSDWWLIKSMLRPKLSRTPGVYQGNKRARERACEANEQSQKK